MEMKSINQFVKKFDNLLKNIKTVLYVSWGTWQVNTKLPRDIS